MSKHRSGWAWIACAMVALCVVGGCKRPANAPDAPGTKAPAASQPVAVEPEPTQAPTDAERPALKVRTFDGKDFDLSAHRGTWVVVNFWATWCAPCLKEMPELSALDAMREHIQVVGLAYEQIETADMQAFLQKHPVVYPVAVVDVADPPRDFATPRGLPMTYLIAPDGKVAKRFLGPVTAKEIEDVIAAAPKSVDPAPVG